MATYTTIVDPGNEQSEWTTDYTSLSAWEAGEQTSYSSGDIAIADCRRSTSAKDTSSLVISGWTAGVSPKIVANENYRHSGLFGDGYVLEPTSGHSLRYYIDVEVDGIELSLDSADYGIYSNGGNLAASNMLISGVPGNGYLATSTSGSSLHNTIIVYEQGNDNGAFRTVSCKNVTVFVPTGVIADQFFRQSECYNCVCIDVDGSRTYGCFYNCTGDYNVSSDTTPPGTNTAESKTSYSDYFVDPANGDFHLKDTSSNLWGLSGTDLSGTFTTDIDGDTRSNWDIGADEYVVVGGTTYQVTCSDGITAGDTPTKRAIFSAACTDGVAAGDSDSNIATLTATLADTLSLSDDAARALVMALTVDDGVTFSDSSLANLLGNLQAECTDGIVLSESLSAIAQFVASCTETIALSDAAVWGSILSALAEDGITLSDSALRSLRLLMACVDGVTVADSGTTTLTFAAVCTDGVAFAETLAAIMRFAATCSDGFEVSDGPSVPAGSTAYRTMSVTFNVKQAKVTFSIRRPNITFSVN